MPSVVYGPGGKWIAHQADEFVEVDDLVTHAAVYVEAADRFLRRVVRTGARNDLTDVAGVAVGHHQRRGRGWLTGTTVVLPPPEHGRRRRRARRRSGHPGDRSAATR